MIKKILIIISIICLTIFISCSDYKVYSELSMEYTDTSESDSRSSGLGMEYTDTSESDSKSSGLGMEFTDEGDTGLGFYKPNTTTVSDASILEKIGNKIIGAIKIVGTVLSVIALSIMGIKYMIGSVEEKAQYKETMIPYVVGSVMLFGIANLLGFIQNVIEDFFR